MQVGWAQGLDFPGMPFNQQMTIPCELSLRPTADGVRMHAWPVREVSGLLLRKSTFAEMKLGESTKQQARFPGELFDVSAEFEAGGCEAFGFRAHGAEVSYDVKKQALVWKGGTAALPAVGGKVRLRLLVDRGSVEVFGNGGAVAVSTGLVIDEKDRGLRLFARGGTGVARSVEVAELRSAWHGKGR